MHGDALPDVYGGFGTSLRFHGVDFSIGFTYQLGGQVLDQGYRFYMNSPAGTSTGNNYHHDLLNSWTPENSGSNIPRFAYNDSNQAAVSDRFLTSASYLNIQNITLGYTAPKRLTRKFLVEESRIYLAATMYGTGPSVRDSTRARLSTASRTRTTTPRFAPSRAV